MLCVVCSAKCVVVHSRGNYSLVSPGWFRIKSQLPVDDGCQTEFSDYTVFSVSVLPGIFLNKGNQRP